MQALIIIFLLLGIAAFITYLLNSFKKPLSPAKPELIDGRPADQWYRGPVPTEADRRETMEWFVRFFKEFPESTLNQHYPVQANLAKALVMIDRLNLQLERGEITQAQFDIEYEKASELIDISQDIV